MNDEEKKGKIFIKKIIMKNKTATISNKKSLGQNL